MDPRAANHLSVVVVTYSAVAVAVALPRLCEQLGAGDQLVVVDNASSDDTVAVVRDVAPEAEIVRTERNTGFAARIVGVVCAGFALVRVVQRLLTGRLGRACWCRAAPSWTTCGGYRAP